jgi:hypothetical protein
MSEAWLHVNIEGGRNIGTNRKPRLQVQFVDLDGEPTTVPEGTYFMDCSLNTFRVGKTEGGWTSVKGSRHPALKCGPGRGPYRRVASHV